MRPARRERLLAAAVVLAGAALALLAATRTWVTQRVTGVPGVVSLTASGSQAAPTVAALAIVGAAAAVVLLIGGRLVARIAGILAALAGAGIVASVVAVLADPRGAAAPAVAGATGRAGPLPDAASPSAWVWLALVGGVVTVAGGLVAAVRAGSWPVPGRRFETGTAAVRRPESTGDGGDDPVAAWDALSRGEDPTG
ncbi:MAG TPA: Trp biosynthesis-associated membrane protein [Kineosporiaceae bacterium]|nr:Trp biosynthesis-associated membrane protein [Kineosporiaceae bacterium]